MYTPPTTQSRYPWRATARTIFAAGVGLALLLPTIADVLGVSAVPWVAGAVAVAASVTRVLAIPGVERWLKDFLPWLAAEPRNPEE